jgi:hypothetical protein
MAVQMLLGEMLIGHFLLRLATEGLDDHSRLNLPILPLEFPVNDWRGPLEAMAQFDAQTSKGVKILCSRVCTLMLKKRLDDRDGLVPHRPQSRLKGA